MGRRKVVVDGTTFANHGIKARAGDAVDPCKCNDWSASREGDLPDKVDLRQDELLLASLAMSVYASSVRRHPD